MKIFEFDEVSSTNSLALEKASELSEFPAWFTARSQTKGRGRGGKPWVSQEGNLFASYLSYQTEPLSQVTELGFLCALAAFDAVCDVAPHCAEWLHLKWPNDILLSQKKLAGILLETEKAPDQDGWYLVAGFGINLSSHPEDADWPATHLSTEKFQVSSDACLTALVKHMSNWSAVYEAKGFAPIREAWVTRGPELGSSMAVKHHGTKISGSYGGLDHDGALLMIRETGELTKIIVGQVAPNS